MFKNSETKTQWYLKIASITICVKPALKKNTLCVLIARESETNTEKEPEKNFMECVFDLIEELYSQKRILQSQISE